MWIKMGLVPAGTLWTLRKAVYGLRIAPRQWGLERDRQLKQVSWMANGLKHRLVQCFNDSQVWRIVAEHPDGSDPAVSSPGETLGLLITYVDDFLLLMRNGNVKDGLIQTLRAIWTMSSQVDLVPNQPFTFLGLEMEKRDNGDIYMHQRGFISKLLANHGLDPCSKGNQNVVMANPTESDGPPDAQLLKRLQGFSGEFNWLATRTRPDLAYYTSVLASASSQHGDWSEQLAKKILRYILATRDQGMLFSWGSPPPSSEITAVARHPVSPSAGESLDSKSKRPSISPAARLSVPPPAGSSLVPASEANDPHQLIVWTDAGYGGVGTRSQTGILISWAGAVVLSRSSKQSNAALSTCESEVAAAAQGFVCVEGLKCLLLEWGVELVAPILLIDNKSALVVCDVGGTWRTRYFAVRAARLADEHRLGNVVLRYCRTDLMAADGLTKLASAQVMQRLREILDGTFPKVEEVSTDVSLTDRTWMASMIRWWVTIGKRGTSSTPTGVAARSHFHPASEDEN